MVKEEIFSSADLQSIYDEAKQLFEQETEESLQSQWYSLKMSASLFLMKVEGFNKKELMLYSNFAQALMKNTFQTLQQQELDLLFEKYEAAFQLDEQINAYYGDAPKKAVFVWSTPTKPPTTYVIELKDLLQLMKNEGRFNKNGTYNQRFSIAPNKKTLSNMQHYILENQFKIKNKELYKHLNRAESAYAGTINRMNRFFVQKKMSGVDVNKNTSQVQKQGAILMWKVGNDWVKAYVLNAGDVKEAYVAALMRKHKGELDSTIMNSIDWVEGNDILCDINDIGQSPYYSHDLIKNFFTEFIQNVDNAPAILGEDIQANQNQYAVKSFRAALPGFDQFITAAQIIVGSSTILGGEELKEEVKKQFAEIAQRNKILENGLNESVEEIINQMIDDTMYTGFTGTFKTVKVPQINI